VKKYTVHLSLCSASLTCVDTIHLSLCSAALMPVDTIHLSLCSASLTCVDTIHLSLCSAALTPVDTIHLSLCSAALTVHMTSLECNTEDDALSADELESTIGDMDEPTDTETESISDGKNHLYTHTNL